MYESYQLYTQTAGSSIGKERVGARATELGMKVGVWDCKFIHLPICKSNSSLRLYMINSGQEFSFTGNDAVESTVFKWVESLFLTVVDVVDSVDQFHSWYHTHEADNYPIKVLFTSPFRQSPPLYYSAVAARFSYHIRFGFSKLSRVSRLARAVAKTD